MKVLMTADTVGGVWTYCLELCAALPEVRFVLAALGPPPSAAQKAAADRVKNLRLESHSCRLEWMPGCERDLAQSGTWLLELAQRHQPDLVHANGYAQVLLPWRVPVLLGAHSCVVSWWRAVHGTDPPQSWGDYRRRVTAAFARADAVVAPSESFLRELLALYGRPRRAYAVYNARQRHDGESTPRRADLVLGAGRVWDEAKNLAVLDRAARDLSAQVCVAGETRAPHGTRTGLCAARALGPLSAEVLRRWMERAAIFVSPALYEPFGLATLEAAHAGCALVLGDIPSQRELWQGVALFVPPRDGDALRTAIAGLLADAPARERLAGGARRRARLYAPRRMATAYRALYRELLPQGAQMEVVA
jgi:glycogen(starch) synthase